MTIFRAFLPEQFEGVVPRLYYVDDASQPDPPEDDPGQCAVGYSLHSVSDRFADPNSAKGMVIRLYVYYKPQLNPGDVERILDVLDHPVQVQARKIAVSGRE